MIDERITTNLSSPPVAEAPPASGGLSTGLLVRERDLRIGQPPLSLAENALRGAMGAAPEDGQPEANAAEPEIAAASAEAPRQPDLRTKLGNFLSKVLPGRVAEVDATSDTETTREAIAEKAEIRKLERRAEARTKQMQPVLFRQARSRLEGRPISGTRS